MRPVPYDTIQQYRTKHDGVITKTYIDQDECEQTCGMFFFPLDLLPVDQQLQLQSHGFANTTLEPCLMREKHIAYLEKGLSHLSSGFASLDASRPWLCYWILHALELLDALPQTTNTSYRRLEQEYVDRAIETLRHFWHQAGGFGGGPMQLGHTATSYATALTLALLGTDSALEVIDRQQLYQFFLSRKHAATGAFTAHEGGEVDVRVTYCVISIASLFGILTPVLTEGVVEYVLSCQTYEGGFGGEPGNEAHGGYAYCAIATLWLLQGLDQIHDWSALLRWLANRQMPLEGGYQGRTNKLVDGCYSFWQGAIPALLYDHMKQHSQNGVETIYPGHRIQLQQYILLCGQQIEGGLRDKPGKPRDHYHTCYCLSGLSIAQHGFNMTEPPVVYGDRGNQLIATHPAYNIGIDKVKRIQMHYQSQGQFVPNPSSQ